MGRLLMDTNGLGLYGFITGRTRASAEMEHTLTNVPISVCGLLNL